MANSSQSPKKDTTVRVPWELLEQMKVIAHAHERSLVAEVRYALNQYVQTPEAKQVLREKEA